MVPHLYEKSVLSSPSMSYNRWSVSMQWSQSFYRSHHGRYTKQVTGYVTTLCMILSPICKIVLFRSKLFFYKEASRLRLNVSSLRPSISLDERFMLRELQSNSIFDACNLFILSDPAGQPIRCPILLQCRASIHRQIRRRLAQVLSA